MVIHAFISSCLDYCNSLFTCLNKMFLNRLQTVQNVFRSEVTGHPSYCLKTRGDRVFQAIAPKLWNGLPSPVCSVDSEVVFRRQIKMFLFRQAFR
ncbi:hypothetical protein LDENG_00157260 [Lucifuga dentata]|nr:hypothetical protein LDENG_00157260 [Lucifuga dentata]